MLESDTVGFTNRPEEKEDSISINSIDLWQLPPNVRCSAGPTERNNREKDRSNEPTGKQDGPENQARLLQELVHSSSGISTGRESLSRSADELNHVKDSLTNDKSSSEDRMKAAGILAANGLQEIFGKDGTRYDFHIDKYNLVDLVITGLDGRNESKGIIGKDGNSLTGAEWRRQGLSDVHTETEKLEGTSKNQLVEDWKKHLKETAEKNIPDEKERARFLTDLEAFHKRAVEQRLSAEEIARTFQQMSRLFDDKDQKLPKEQCLLAAETCMHHLANPKNIDQGYHNTCNVTTLQEHLMTKNPSAAVEILATVTQTGAWTAPDGKKVWLDEKSLVPGAEERHNPPLDGSRSYATQLLNLALANDINQRKMPPCYYSQHKPSGQSDTGEALCYQNGAPVMKYNAERQLEAVHGPAITSGAMAAELQRLTGEGGVVIANGAVDGQSGLVTVNAPQDLHDALSQAKMDGHLPAIIMVNVNAPGFPGAKPENGPGWHVVSVTSYDEKTGKVGISNQWGSQFDTPIDYRTLYTTTKAHQKPAA